MNIGTDISAKFANMGFVCVCLVVLMHVHCLWEGGGINQLAVPFFFAMSGYFLAAHVEEDGWYAKALSKRLRTLIVPLFAWCMIWALVTIPLAMALNVRAGRELFSNVLTGWDALRYLALDITRTPALGPLWYVRCLFLFVVASPVVVWLIRKVGFVSLLVFGCLYYAYSARGVVMDFLSYGFSLEGIFYFSTGLYLRMKHIPLNVGPLIGVPLFALGVSIYVMGQTELSIPVMIVGLWGMMPTRQFPRFLVCNTFPIYLMHMFVLLAFGTCRIVSVMWAIGVGSLTVVIVIIIAEGIRRIMPKVTPFLYGGR